MFFPNNNDNLKQDSVTLFVPFLGQSNARYMSSVDGLNNWLSDRQAQPTDEIAVIWSQGEADALSHLGEENSLDRELFKQSTLDVFDYLQANLDYPQLTFYLVPTGRFQEEAAINREWSTERIDLVQEGRKIVREVQAEIALERDDIQLVSDYSDLNTVYEEGLVYGDSYDHSYEYWSQDVWHLGHDGLKVNGDRLAQYIAVDRGQSNVISYTDSFGNPAESIALSRAGFLDLNLADNSRLSVIRGSNFPDLLVGTLEADQLVAEDGNDLILPSQGADLNYHW